MVYIFLGRGFEEIEAIAPGDILRRGGVSVSYVSIDGSTMVEGAHGISIAADLPLEALTLEDAELFVIPGGLGGVESVEASPAAMECLRMAKQQNIPLAAICAGPRVLARLDITKGRQIVCYPGMETQMGEATVIRDQTTAVDGDLITGRGPGAALDFGLQLLRFLRGDAAAQAVAEGMTYHFPA